jgi:signal transduction histidine kinase
LGANPTLAQRREALRGFVYSSFRMRDLMQGVVGDLNLIRLRIYDGDAQTSDNLMFDSAGSLDDVRGGTPPRFQTIETLSTRGANWTLDFTSLPAFRQGDATDNQPAIVLFAGLICCGLFGLVVWSWGATRTYAVAMASEMVASINQQKADLLASNQALEQFAYVASHDLRAPLRNISFIVSWIIEDHAKELSTAITDRLGDLRKCSERMDTLLNSILEYSRLGGTGKQMQLVDTNQIVADAIGLICPPGGMTISVQEDLPNFHGASVRMSQVFANLIGNAIKHHDLLYGVITITGTTRDGECEFRVRDDGPGIDPKFHDRVFEMFKTLRSRDEVEGSGMGLSIVQKTIEQHGGRIWIEDNGQARGTTFVFTIPLGAQND